MTINDAIAGMRTLLATVSGLSVPATLPSTINTYPVALVYSRSGEVDQTVFKQYRGMHKLHIDLLHSRTPTPEAMSAVAAWPDAFGALFAESPDLDGAAVTIISPWTYDVAELQYAGQAHFGIRFEVTVKCLTNVP